MKRNLILVLVLGCSLVLPWQVTVAQGLPDFVALIDTEDVMAHVRALSVAIGARPMGSQAEALAADYVAAAWPTGATRSPCRNSRLRPPVPTRKAQPVNR